MISSFRQTQKLLPLLIILLLTVFQLIRVIIFVGVYGGIEHDGGWALTVSRSLVEHGTYTTTVSTIIDPSVPGDFNIHKKFDIQTPDGRIWFRSSSVTGPASIVPNALAMKIFGLNYWGLRAGPLIFYILFLLLAAYICYKLAKLSAVFLFYLFIFFYPHLSIFLSYQALGEIPSMFYILWAYLAFAWATKKTPQRWYYFFAAGLVAGLAVIAKLITFLSLSGIFIWAGVLWLAGLSIINNRAFLKKLNPIALNNIGTISTRRITFTQLLALGGGTILVWILWEITQWLVLVKLTNMQLYGYYLHEKFGEFLDAGSGLREQSHTDLQFFWDKFFRLQEIAHPQQWVTALIFVAILGGGLMLIWLWRAQPDKQNLLAPIWLGWLANMVWFVGMSKTGWPRHIWLGLILAVILLCVVTITLLQQGLRINKNWTSARALSLITGILLFLLIGWGFIRQPYVWSLLLSDKLVPYWQQKQINDKYDAYLPWIIIPRSVQAEIINYINQLPAEANVYYPQQHKAAEISAATGRIFYPINRRPLMQPHPQDIAIVGPSLGSPWMDPMRRAALLDLVKEDCPQPLLVNNFYMICPLPDK